MDIILLLSIELEGKSLILKEMGLVVIFISLCRSVPTFHGHCCRIRVTFFLLIIVLNHTFLFSYTLTQRTSCSYLLQFLHVITFKVLEEFTDMSVFTGVIPFLLLKNVDSSLLMLSFITVLMFSYQEFTVSTYKLWRFYF